MSHPKLLAIVLAGGKGERLFPLTAMRSKPAVPFGGRYRIVDFVLSNLVNSSIYAIYLLVQYKSQSLIEHIRQTWVLSPIVRGHFIAVVPPQMRMGPDWFQGTADAVLQNYNLIQDQNPELVIVFGSDHIYRMDIRQMIDFHLESEADVTVAARPVPREEASSFGVIAVDGDRRITSFLEKPADPPHIPGNPEASLVSMGNYIFRRDVLLRALSEARQKKQDDFGRHVLPSLVGAGARVFAYDFATNTVPGIKPYEEPGYWRDVGSIETFYNAHMDMLGCEPRLDLNNPQWPIYSGSRVGASAYISDARISNSLISEGAVIHGARIGNSIISNGVHIEPGVVVEDSIVMDGVRLRRDSAVRRVIIDKANVIEEGARLGFDGGKDRFICHIDRSGIPVVPKKGRKVPRNGER